jgi:hypothetical protein
MFSITDTSPLPSAGKLQLAWPSATGVLYRVSQSSDLTHWSVVRDWAGAASPPEDALDMDLSPSNGYFKVEADIQ